MSKHKKKYETGSSSSSSESGSDSSDSSSSNDSDNGRKKLKKAKPSRESSADRNRLSHKNLKSRDKTYGGDSSGDEESRKKPKHAVLHDKRYKSENPRDHHAKHEKKHKDTKFDDRPERRHNEDRREDDRRQNDDRSRNKRQDYKTSSRKDDFRGNREDDYRSRERRDDEDRRGRGRRDEHNDDYSKDRRNDGYDNRGRDRTDNDHRNRNRRDQRQDRNNAGRGNRRSRSKSFDHANARWGKGDDSKKPDKKVEDKQKPNFGLSGKLTEETNTYKGIVIKYSEPPEARKPRRRWRLYPFKGEKALQTLYIHRESAYLIGRERKVVDLPVDHPSCSKQHAALQYRLVPFTRDDGSVGKRVRPYLIDLESANGTFINNKKIESKKYVELLEKDVIKFGFSSREYVLLHENSKDEALDDDVKQEEEEMPIKEEPQ